MKKDDHGPEALGRFMMGYFGEGIIEIETKVRKAKINVGRKHGKSLSKRGKPLSSMIPVKPGFPDWRNEWR
jgi:hypothetical protein